MTLDPSRKKSISTFKGRRSICQSFYIAGIRGDRLLGESLDRLLPTL